MHDTTVADVLSWVTTCLYPDMVRSILNGVALGISALGQGPWPHHSPRADHHLEQEVHVTSGCMHLCKFMSLIGAKAQEEDPMLKAKCLDWLQAQKKTDLKALLAEHASSKEGWLILWNSAKFCMIHQGTLYLHSMPKGETEDLLLSVVPKAHCVAALNGCHRDAGHQVACSYLVLFMGAILVVGNG